MQDNKIYDVAVIGAGPSGAIAASILKQQGRDVVVVEKQHFPRFSIGESLLPHAMQFIEQAGLLEALLNNAADMGFQFKNGAAFYRSGERSSFDFEDKFSPGPGTTFQVKRADFDKLLADETAKKGVPIHYGVQVEQVEINDELAQLTVLDEAGQTSQINAKFILDASGFGRVLPKLLDLELPSELFPRQAVFTHIKDNIPADANFDRNKILVTVHPEIEDLWYWLIPFSDGTASFGVVARPECFAEAELEQQLYDFIKQDENLASLLANAEIIQPARKIGGYSSNVKQMYGDKFALLGNAGEFLDPVFSSGVTIAMRSAALAAELVDKQLAGEAVDWSQDYQAALKKGIEVFKHFVMSWYDTSLQNIIFFQSDGSDIKPMISSILAGYAWDTNNPFVADTNRGLHILTQLCETD